MQLTDDNAVDLARAQEVGEALIDEMFDCGRRIEERYGALPYPLFIVSVRAIIAVTIDRVSRGDREAALKMADEFSAELRQKIMGLMPCN
jgi:predicted Co/Zn/Cd cation transporter (cation efflux family)